MTTKTPLEKLQAQIDRCNHKCGCDSKCTEADQANCRLLKDHLKRMDYCMENNIPIELW